MDASDASRQAESPRDNIETLTRADLHHSIIVAGEASESDEDEEPVPMVTQTTVKNLPPLKVNQQESGDSLDLEDGHSRQPISDENQDIPPKYDTLLHRKLRDRNVAFRKHLCATFGQLYLSGAKDLNNTTAQMIKSQAVAQEISNQMRFMTNDLFQLEDKINIIASCNILPEIKIVK